MQDFFLWFFKCLLRIFSGEYYVFFFNFKAKEKKITVQTFLVFNFFRLNTVLKDLNLEPAPDANYCSSDPQHCLKYSVSILNNF